ncbi:MAG: tail fiber domain-containing protein [Dehalococcoidia bacterium]
MATARLGLSTLTAGVSTRANLISYWNANLAILDNTLTTNAGTLFVVGHGSGVITSNVAVGRLALNSNTTGANNTAIGKYALYSNTTGANNTAVGDGAMYVNTTGNYNVAVGASALHDNTGGTENTAVGCEALQHNLAGKYNTAVGRNALTVCTDGISNTAVGYRALLAVTTGISNTAVGSFAGNAITTGQNVTCIGYNAQASTATTTNEIVLGDANIARLRCQVTTITALSDERDKANIEDLPLGLAFLRDLKPRRFNWHKRIRNEDGTLGERGEIGAVDSGFVAQELQAAAETHSAEWMELIFSMQDGEVLETTTGKLLPVAIKAIQELAATVDALTARIAALEPA